MDQEEQDQDERKRESYMRRALWDMREELNKLYPKLDFIVMLSSKSMNVYSPDGQEAFSIRMLDGSLRRARKRLEKVAEAMLEAIE